jgi:predicted nucleic acid-binding protein
MRRNPSKPRVGIGGDEDPVFPVDLVTARIHASLWAGLAAKGATIGSHDLLIGATTAIALEHRVATRDRRSFGRSRDWKSSSPEKAFARTSKAG